MPAGKSLSSLESSEQVYCDFKDLSTQPGTGRCERPSERRESPRGAQVRSLVERQRVEVGREAGHGRES